MSFLDKLLKPKSSDFEIITVNTSADYAELPKGFFRVQTASGVDSLGYNGSFLAWRVGTVVVDGAQRIPAPTGDEREKLPLVRLDFKQKQSGVTQVNGVGIMDTDSMPGEFDGNVGYGGVNAPRCDGLEFI
jgi:hypothetical protein